MSVGEIIGIVKLCLLLAPSFVLLGVGLRYLFYNVDAWNLDRFYVRFLNGRRKKKYRQFTQRVGLVLLIVGLIYTWLVVKPIISELFEKNGQ